MSICAPNVLHREIGLAAAEAGKPFWIEKPVGRDARETGEAAAAARKAGIATSIGYNYRHAPAVEHVRELVAQGALGRITNVRAVFFSGYAAEPRGALSWRFKRALAGSGALGDLLSHVVDLVSYLVGPIAEVSALTSTVYAERPILPMGSGTHFAVIEDGELGPVENEDYAATLVRFSPTAQGPGAVGTLEASRTIVGPQCGLGFELYGTDGSAVWNFERMNELRLCLGRGGPHQGYTTVLGNAHLGDYARFQPGPGHRHGLRRPQGHRGQAVPRRGDRRGAPQRHRRGRARRRRGHRRRRLGRQRRLAGGSGRPGRHLRRRARADPEPDRWLSRFPARGPTGRRGTDLVRMEEVRT